MQIIVRFIHQEFNDLATGFWKLIFTPNEMITTNRQKDINIPFNKTKWVFWELSGQIINLHRNNNIDEFWCAKLFSRCGYITFGTDLRWCFQFAHSFKVIHTYTNFSCMKKELSDKHLKHFVSLVSCAQFKYVLSIFYSSNPP